MVETTNENCNGRCNEVTNRYWWNELLQKNTASMQSGAELQQKNRLIPWRKFSSASQNLAEMEENYKAMTS